MTGYGNTLSVYGRIACGAPGGHRVNCGCTLDCYLPLRCSFGAVRCVFSLPMGDPRYEYGVPDGTSSLGREALALKGSDLYGWWPWASLGEVLSLYYEGFHVPGGNVL